MGRNVVDVGIPPFADLLAATDLVQRNDSVCRLRLEVRRRVVERDVPVFADADAGKVDRALADRSLQPRAFSGRVGRIAADKGKVFHRAGQLRQQAFSQEAAKRRRMVCLQSDVFVEVEPMHLRPVDPAVRDERLEELELAGGGGEDDPRLAALRDRRDDLRGGGLRRKASHSFLRLCNSYLHFSLSY